MRRDDTLTVVIGALCFMGLFVLGIYTGMLVGEKLCENNQCEGWYEMGRCMGNPEDDCAQMLFKVKTIPSFLSGSISECLHEYERGYLEMREELWGELK